MNEPVELSPRQGREGNRWANERPTSEALAEWFQTVKLHDGMEHEDWISGITLIQATEKQDEVLGFDSSGRPNIMRDVQNVFYIPYPKVETRVNYFDKLVEQREDWSGFILPVAAADPKGMSVGYFAVKVALPDGKAATAICYTARMLVIKGDVTWYAFEDADGVTRRYPTGKVLMEHTGTKSVPFLDRYGKLDANAMMKAETGAKGRALGFAGMLVIPGTGVATAEDMQESLSQGTTPGAPAVVEQEDAAPAGDDALRAEAVSIMHLLPREKLTEFQAWAREREFGKLSEVEGPALKGLVKKLQKMHGDTPGEPQPELDIDLSGEDEAPVAEAAPEAL